MTGPDRPMWCDEFDMDLPKIFPDLKDRLGSVVDIQLFTHSHTTYGVINCPCAWNDHLGLVSFFGFKSPCKPRHFWADAPAVSCTVWEAFRDLWSHQHVMVLQREHVACDFRRLWPAFSTIMGDLRGWNKCDTSAARQAALKTIVKAASVIGALAERHDATSSAERQEAS